MGPLVTIAIPTYSRLSYLKEAVASALAQTYSNVEVLISQDPRPDGLDESINTWSEALANQNSKVRYRFNTYNLGLAGNWNALADAAEGEYLVIPGDDDRLLPNFTELMVNAINSDINLAFANHYIINSQGVRLESESYQYTQHYHRDVLLPGEVQYPEVLIWQNSIPMSASLIRTQDVQKLRFKEDLNTPEIELFIRLAQAGGRFAFVPHYVSEYRVHERSATRAGLRIEKLVSYLLTIPVHPTIEPYKEELLSSFMVNAVSQCLLQKEHYQARRLFASKYYPYAKRVRPMGWLQALCTSLPSFAGCQLYQLGYQVKHHAHLK
ncbi:MAG: glycosyltransferase [Trichocoleus desertorum ATA4-8-CV12]|jgi:glycosyltransferase involved in cell wall biosynthesis|nr:glycosyltransferase [Trichocoleus desertorum ATA4-8-CV12]